MSKSVNIMLKKIDHIGIAVKNLEDSAVFYKALGMQISHIEKVPEQKVKVGFISTSETNIELLEPTDCSSPVAKFIEKKGEGMHHICFKVSDIKTTLTTLKNQGYRLIDMEPKSGAHNTLIAFVHPKSANGVLIELSQDIIQ